MTGDELKAWRAERGWSKYRLAKELGVAESTVLRWESGQHPIPKITVVALRCLADGGTPS